MDDKVLADKSNMYQVLERYPDMLREAMGYAKNIRINGNISSICVTGMGGSAFPGDLLKSFMKDSDIPVYVNKTYALPKYVDSSTLVFAISYSGNTEETISSYREAIKRKATVVTITSGGKIEELSRMNNTPCIKVPKGIQPRLSTLYLFTPMLNVLSEAGVIPDQKPVLEKTINMLKNPALRDRAKEIASRMKDKVPIIYSSEDIFCVAEKWKGDINENAKTPAFYNVFPEFNHNEINAYVNLVGKYYVIMIEDAQDHPQVKKRIKIIKKLIMGKGVDVMEIAITGEDLLTRLVSGIYLGVWVSYYLALEYGTDPTPVDIIEDLKRELAR